jgi:hypothetical protein
MTKAHEPLPEDNDGLRSALLETRAELAGAQAMIAHLQLVIAKMRRDKFGPRSERSQRILDQLELQLEERGRARHVRDLCCDVFKRRAIAGAR